MKNIKEIHTFGTSFTAGGGYLWDLPDETINSHPNLKKILNIQNNYYKETPKTMFHYSWPGQLQKLLGDNVKVFNYAKEGFGNETMYRITNDILWDGNTFTNCDDKIFIYEFSGLGRKEFWSNSINDYIVMNYGSSRTNSLSSRPIKDLNFVGVQQQYLVNDASINPEKYTDVEPFARTYLKESIDLQKQMKLCELNNHMFIDSLLYRNVNFYSVGADPEYPLDDIKNAFIDFKGYSDFVDMAFKDKITITGEDLGIKDDHLSLSGNKIVAKIIGDKITYDMENS